MTRFFSGPRDHRRAGCRSLALFLGVLSLGGADVAAALDSSPASDPSDLVVEWRYDALGTTGSFRLYRGTDLLDLEPVAESTIRAGTAKHQRIVVTGARRTAAVYQLCYVDARGQETVLETFTWTPPSVAPKALIGSAPSWSAAVLRSEVSQEALASTTGVGGESARESDLWRREPAVPPPR